MFPISGSADTNAVCSVTTQHATPVSHVSRQVHTFSILTFFFAGMALFSLCFFCGFLAIAGPLLAGIGVLPFACKPRNTCHQNFSMQASAQDFYTPMTGATGKPSWQYLAHIRAEKCGFAREYA